MKTLTVIMKSGLAFTFQYEEDDYDSIYDNWFFGEQFMTFCDGEVKTSEVAAIKWGA